MGYYTGIIIAAPMMGHLVDAFRVAETQGPWEASDD